eukprot:comp92749_c0_seq1/m.48616 comp92749_c0_seq1/g.48616  ORF comp92749_c0_seq1/g.48616 comp92749_c0_seq1/m.48616 type:complete len:140 (+) comp92749_c0_seq1:46-465(+)
MMGMPAEAHGHNMAIQQIHFGLTILKAMPGIMLYHMILSLALQHGCTLQQQAFFHGTSVGRAWQNPSNHRPALARSICNTHEPTHGASTPPHGHCATSTTSPAPPCLQAIQCPQPLPLAGCDLHVGLVGLGRAAAHPRQ